MFKIKFDEENCIGCQACKSVCDNWVMKDNKAKPKKNYDFRKRIKK